MGGHALLPPEKADNMVFGIAKFLSQIREAHRFAQVFGEIGGHSGNRSRAEGGGCGGFQRGKDAEKCCLPCRFRAVQMPDFIHFLKKRQEIFRLEAAGKRKRMPGGCTTAAFEMQIKILSQWGAARWFECLIPIFWLYERRPEEWLLELAVKLRCQGTNYEALYDGWFLSRPQQHWTFLSHVVNAGMSLKSMALMSRITGEDPDAFAEKAWQTLMRDHGMPCGHFSGDECFAGTSPIRGSELCSVAEAMYSYEWLAAICGGEKWGDRLECAAFNALPASISPDMWSHQYGRRTALP